MSTTIPTFNPKPNLHWIPHISICTFPSLLSFRFILLPSLFISLHKMTAVGSGTHFATSGLRSFDRVFAKMGNHTKRVVFFFYFHQYTNYLQLHVLFFHLPLKDTLRQCFKSYFLDC